MKLSANFLCCLFLVHFPVTNLLEKNIYTKISENTAINTLRSIIQLIKQSLARIVEVIPLYLSLIVFSILLTVGNHSPEFGVHFHTNSCILTRQTFIKKKKTI